LHQIGLFQFSLFHLVYFVVSVCLVFLSLKSIMNHHHAAFWSDPYSTSSSEVEIEERHYTQEESRDNSLFLMGEHIYCIHFR
jgi:hypothetical protein